MNAVSHKVGRLVYWCLGRLTRNDGLIGQFVVGNVSTGPLENGVVNQVLQAGNQVSSSLMGGVILVLVNVSDQEWAGISQSHPLEVVASAVICSSSADKGTTFSVKLSVGGRCNQVALILLTVERAIDTLSVVLGDTLNEGRTTDNVLDVVGILHEHEVAANWQNLSHHGDVSVKSGSRDCYKAVFRVGGGVDVVHQAGVTNINRGANSRVRLDRSTHSNGNRSRDFAVISFVTGNIVDGNHNWNTQPLTARGVTGGAVASNQLEAVDGHLNIHHITSQQSGRQGGGVELGSRRQELDLDDLVRSANANDTQVAHLSVLEELVYAVVAQQGDTTVGNG